MKFKLKKGFLFAKKMNYIGHIIQTVRLELSKVTAVAIHILEEHAT